MQDSGGGGRGGSPIYLEDADGEADEINTDPELSDRPLTESQLLEIIKPNTARVFTVGILAKMGGLREGESR